MGADYKYDIEGAFIPRAEAIVCMPAGELYRLSDQDRMELSHYHIYMVCTRPALRAELTGRDDNGDWVLEIEWSDDSTATVTTDRIMTSAGDVLSNDEFTISVSEDGSRIAYLVDGETVNEEWIAQLVAHNEEPKREGDRTIDHLTDLRVEYVGKAFGQGGDRNVIDRLTKHETLQRIAIEVGTDREAWLVLFAFTGYDQIAMFGPWEGRDVDTTIEEQVERTLRPDYDPEVVTNVAEACLIRHFRPAYNTVYRDTFPQRDHKILETPYGKDINSVGIDLNTFDIAARLHSPEIDPSWIHAVPFPLHTAEERAAMFDFFASPAPDFVASDE